MLVCNQENEAGTLFGLNGSWLDTTTCFVFIGEICIKIEFLCLYQILIVF